MVGKNFRKTIFKTIFHNRTKFLVNALIVLVSVTITAGLGILSNSFKPSFLENYKNGNAPDLILKNKKESGFNSDDIKYISSIDNVDEVYAFFNYDIKNNGKYQRLYFYDLYSNIAKSKLIKGRLPNNYDEIVIEDSMKKGKLNVGDTYTFNNYPLAFNEIKEFKIVGIIDSPLYNSSQVERSYTEEEDYIEHIFYISYDTVPEVFKNRLPNTDIYLTLKNKSEYMTDSYKEDVSKIKDILVNHYHNDIEILTLDENTSYALYYNYDRKIVIISIIFPIMFIVVGMLVLLLMITKLINDERSMIGCYYSLGVDTKSIVIKYLMFSLISTILGTVGGYFIGCTFFPRFIYKSYQALYEMNGIGKTLYSAGGLMMVITLLVFASAITILSVLFLLKEKPAELLKSKAPDAGKRILLERISFIWKHLSFSLKSSFRNIFRYKKNLILTSLSVIGSTILVFLGFALNDSVNELKNSPLFGGLSSSMGLVSTVIILFGVIMSTLVVYALCGMNIDARIKEIAVLKVLGYYDKESAFYAFRDLLIITFISALIGVPLSLGLTHILFNFLELGTISSICWYSYILTFVIVFSSSIISCFMLYPKIRKIDFNISLKSVE